MNRMRRGRAPGEADTGRKKEWRGLRTGRVWLSMNLMNRSRRKSTAMAYIAGLLALFLLSAPPGALAQLGAPPPLFAPTTVTGDLGTAADPTIVRSRPVAINLHLLAQADGSPRQWAPGGALKLNLFDDVSFTALFDRVELNAPNSFAWIGRIDGIDLSQVILVVRDQIMMGSISMPGALYQIRYAGGGLHAVHELNPGAFPPEQPPLPVDPADLDASAPAAAAAIPDDGSLIDVLVVYTAAARVAAGGTTAMNTLIDLAKTETNTSYANSGITQRIRIVHTAEVSYTESGVSSTDLNNLTNTSDGFMDNVHTLRNTYAADLVTLLVENAGGFCGRGWIMTSVTPSFASNGFNVVARNCATGNYSFGHELGHNMSARHDWYVDSTNNSPYTYNHGHVNVSGPWRTIMSYNNQCADSGVVCTRIPYWSNPDVLYGGAATGVPEGSSNAADNRKALNNTAVTVANFRASPTFTLTVTKAGTGTGTVTSSPAGIDCGPTCAASFATGTPVDLTATPDPDSTFAGWSGDPDCTDGSVTLDANKTCTATFNLSSGPDLTGVWNPVSQSCRLGQCKLQGSVQVWNQGSATAPASLLRVILSDDAVLDPGDTVLQESSIRSLLPGRSRTSKVKVKLPLGVTASGKYLFAVIDPLNGVAETIETNNTLMYGPIP